MNNNYDYLYKILLIGDTGVGKSALMYRFADNTYSENFVSTIGVDFKVKTINIGNKRAKIQIWDTAGQCRFRSIISCYYKGSHGIIIIFDITDRNSFNNVKIWLNEIKKNAKENIDTILIGNKCDILNRRKVSIEEATEFADSLDIDYIETSAKDNLNIEKMYMTIVEKINKKNIINNKSTICLTNSSKINLNNKKNSCC